MQPMPMQREPGVKSVHEKDGDDFSIIDLCLVILEHKRLILTTAASCGVLVAMIILLLPTKYKATTTFLPPAQGQSSASAAVLAQLSSLGPLAAAGQGSLGLKNPLDLQTSLLKSESVRQAVVDHFHLMSQFHAKKMSDAIKKLDQQTDIDANAKDGLIRLSVTDKSPERAAELTRGYLDAYVKLTARLALSEAAQRRLFFEQRLEEEKEKLAASEESLKQTEQTSGLVQADSQARALFQNAASLQAQITGKQIQVDSMRIYAGSGNVDLLQAEQELAGLKAALAKLGNGPAPAAGSFDLSKGNLPAANLEYLRRARDVKYHETLFEILARQYESARLDEAKEGAPVQVVDQATPPDHRNPRYLALLTLGGILLGGAGSAFWVALQSGFEGNEKHHEQIRHLRRALRWKPTETE